MSVRSVVLGGAVAVVLALGGWGASGARAAGAPQISAAASAGTVKVGQTSLLTGTVRSGAGSRLPGVAVELWSRAVGSPVWTHVANAKSNGVGEYAFSQRIVVATVSQVRAPVSGAQSGPVVVGAIEYFQAVAFAGCNDAPHHSYGVYSGRTTPYAAGSTAVALYRAAVTDPWSESGRTVVKADGTFVWRGAPSQVFSYEMRWVLAKKGVTANASPIYSGYLPGWDFQNPTTTCSTFHPAT